jgi:putative transposase
MSRDLADVRLAALMVDGIELKGRCCIVALGVSTDGVKLPLGFWDGSTENKTITMHLLADLAARGLDVEQGVLVVLDGSKALRAAVDEVFGPVPVQRCIRHKERNVLDHLPERDRPAVKARLRRAWASDRHTLALDGLLVLAGELEHSHPGAAASLNEGLEETLTLTRLGIRGRLKKTLASTNPIESMIEIIRRTSRNVKHWQSGDMCLRWTAAGMLEAETQFRKVVGYSDLAKLALAVKRDIAAQRATLHTPTHKEALTPASV